MVVVKCDHLKRCHVQYVPLEDPGVGEVLCELPPLEGLEELLAIVFSGQFQPVPLTGQCELWTLPETSSILRAGVKQIPAVWIGKSYHKEVEWYSIIEP